MTSSQSDEGAPRSLTYRDAGVDIDAGHEAVRRIRALVGQTRRPEQLDELGGFAGLFRMPAGFREPVLVSCTDGVGTKLLVAIAMQRHDTVGIDLVAMNVNDLLCTGATPLFVLDYIACGRLDPVVVEQLVSGIVTGCRQAGCALLGGETAELPGMYADGHYDLAAFAVGVVDADDRWTPERIAIGDAIVALPSSGLHSNGYSLARRALLRSDGGSLRLTDPLPSAPDVTVGDALLTPTRIYADAFATLRALPGAPLHGAAHITGGGLIDNPGRALPPHAAAHLDLRDVPCPPILTELRARGIDRDELRRTFNCGVGMLLYVAAERVDEVVTALHDAGESCYRVGEVVPRDTGPAVIIAE